MVEVMSRRLLIEKALRITQQRHGALKEPPKRLSSHTGVTEVGTAIKLLSCFPAGSQEAGRAARSLCTIVGSSTHLTPGPALKESLKHSYYRLAAASFLQTDWTQANFVGAWQFVRVGMERKVQEWGEVGVVTDDILEMITRARRGGNKLSRQEYTELLKVCLCISEGRGSHMTSALGAVFDMMVDDCGLEVAQEVVICSCFQVATSEDQIHIICQLLGNTARQRPRVFQTAQLSACVTAAGNSPKRVMDVFTQYLLTVQTPPTMDVYECMLSTCATKYQLHWALNVFNAMTVSHGVAPSREAYNTLTTILSRRAFNRDKNVTKKSCHQVLAATEHAYGGKTPLWAYAEMAKALVPLMGREGYNIMYRNCEKMLDQMYVEESERRLAMRRVWRPSLYISLIKGSVVRGDRDLALHMLSEMRRWGFAISTKAYMPLLQLISQPGHQDDYLTALFMGMSNDLNSTRGLFLQAPLANALTNVWRNKYRSGSPTGQALSPLPSRVAAGVLEATLTNSDHHNCLQHLTRLADADKAHTHEHAELSKKQKLTTSPSLQMSQ